ncbi:MAG: bactofilin family protein [Noviherbaspirillum sp.]
MFGHKSNNTIESLVGLSTIIEGNIYFRGGLRIDGHVKGNVIAEPENDSMLVISEQAKVEGEIRVAHLQVNGEVVGTVYSSAHLELQPKARITGDVHYNALEMHGGARISGKLTHTQSGEPFLKLAMPELLASDA